MFSLIDLTIWQLGIELQGFELHHNLTTIMNDDRDYSIRLPIQKVPSGPPCPAVWDPVKGFFKAELLNGPRPAAYALRWRPLGFQ